MGSPRANAGSPTAATQEAESPTAGARSAATPVSRAGSTSSTNSSLANSMEFTDDMVAASLPHTPKSKLSQSFPPLRRQRLGSFVMGASVVGLSRPTAPLAKGLPPRHGKLSAIETMKQETPPHLVDKRRAVPPKPVAPQPAVQVVVPTPETNPFVDPDQLFESFCSESEDNGRVSVTRSETSSKPDLSYEEYSEKLCKELGEYKCDAASKYKNSFCAIASTNLITPTHSALAFMKANPDVAGKMFSTVAEVLFAHRTALAPFEKALDKINSLFLPEGQYYNNPELGRLKADDAIAVLHLHAKSLLSAPVNSATQAAAAQTKPLAATPAAAASQSYAAMFYDAASKAGAALCSTWQSTRFVTSATSAGKPNYAPPKPAGK